MYFPLVTLAYNEEPVSLVAFNFYDFMFNARACFLWILTSSMIFLLFKAVKDYGMLLYPRYRDLIVNNSDHIRQIRAQIVKRNRTLLQLDLEEDEAHYREKRKPTIHQKGGSL